MNIQSSRTWYSNHSSFMENPITCHRGSSRTNYGDLNIFAGNNNNANLSRPKKQQESKKRGRQMKKKSGAFLISCLIQTIPILEMPRNAFVILLLSSWSSSYIQRKWLPTPVTLSSSDTQWKTHPSQQNPQWTWLQPVLSKSWRWPGNIGRVLSA